MSMRLSTVPIPVRLNKELIERLQAAARRLGSNRSAVIRFAVFNQLPLIESGRLVLTDEAPAKKSSQ